jgi:nucleotide-binding universal stress UspA family protein
MKILLAIDGSDHSKAAIAFCRNIITNPENTSIKILSAVERPAPIGPEPFAVSAEYYTQVEQAGRQQAKVFVEDAETQVQALFPDSMPNVSEEVISGSPQRAIVERAKEWGADLIVLGSHGYGFWSRALLGSVSTSVVNHAPCSVMVVHDNESLNGNKR